MSAFEWFVARRYLFSRERKTLVSIITLISVAGVAVGVAALIVVIGVMDGADQLIFGKIAEVYPHLRIKPAQGSTLAIDPALLTRLRARPEVRLVEPMIQRQAFVQPVHSTSGPARPTVIQLIGVDSLGKDQVYNIPNMQTHEDITLEGRNILIGAPLAYGKLQLAPGASVWIMATNPLSTALTPVLKTSQYLVYGTFSTNVVDFDSNTAFISSDEMRRMFRVPPGHADFIFVKLKNAFDAEAVKAALKLGPEFKVTTWAEENHEFFSALKLEKLGMFLILLLAVLVAAFNIIGTLILMVIEKTREVGILRAVGASQRTIARVFLLDGVMIGLVGTAAGAAIGIGLCLLIPLWKLNIPTAVSTIDHLPVEIRPFTVTIVVLSSLVICTLGAIFPARQAARLNPVEALRYD